MPNTASVAISRISELLLDEGMNSVLLPQIISAMNESIKQLLADRPDEFIEFTSVDLADGNRQSLPDGAIRLVRLTHNSNDAPILEINWSTITKTLPTWISESSTGEIEHYIYDERDPKNYFVYPKATQGMQVFGSFVMEPSPITDNDDTVIPVSDNYYNAFIDYALAKCFRLDAMNPIAQQNALTCENRYNQALGKKMQSDFYMAEPKEKGQVNG